MTAVMSQASESSEANAPQPFKSKWASRYRGAVVSDLDPPAALSLNPSDPIGLALQEAFEREYTHLTIVDSNTRALLGYISIPHLQQQIESGRAKPEDEIRTAMTSFQRKGRKYTAITPDTPLEQLEAFFDGAHHGGQKQDFAVVTDDRRRFVLGVATAADLEEFVKRRPEKRHRKCDETRPGCHQCSVSGWKCDYLDDVSPPAQAPSQSASDGRIVAAAAQFNHYPPSRKLPLGPGSLSSLVRPPPSFLSQLSSAESSGLAHFKFNMQMVHLANNVPTFEKTLIRSIYTEPAIRHVGIASSVAFNHDHWNGTSPITPDVLKKILLGCNMAIRELGRPGDSSPSASSRPPELSLLVGTVLAACSWHLGDCDQLAGHLRGMLRILLEKRGAMLVASEDVEIAKEIPAYEMSRQATLGAAYITWVRVLDRFLAWNPEGPADELDEVMLQLNLLLDRSRELDMTEAGYKIVSTHTHRSTFTWDVDRRR
ncbi:hypothetical protein PspLS_05489 [Pyricularia sp. CBS 133598]|nr:hypothetical protein PspLS_05489 [Pyricularia sp. CBS 133598]